MLEDIEILLKQHPKVSEAYIIVREVKIYLNCKNNFQPCIKIRIYKNTVSEKEPYTFKLSHHVHTPLQLSPYYPSLSNRETESAAILNAIESVVPDIDSAIEKGHEPSHDWLIPNESW